MSFRNLYSSDLGRKTVSSERLAKQICLTAIQECMIKGQSQHVFTMFWWRSHNLRPLIKEVLSCRSHLWTHPIYIYIDICNFKSTKAPGNPEKLLRSYRFNSFFPVLAMAALAPLLRAPRAVAIPGSVETFSSRNVDQAALGSDGAFRSVSPPFAGKSCLRPLGKGVDRDLFFDFGAYFLKRWGHKRSLKVIRPSVWRYIIIVELWLYIHCRWFIDY